MTSLSSTCSYSAHIKYHSGTSSNKICMWSSPSVGKEGTDWEGGVYKVSQTVSQATVARIDLAAESFPSWWATLVYLTLCFLSFRFPWNLAQSTPQSHPNVCLEKFRCLDVIFLVWMPVIFLAFATCTYTFVFFLRRQVCSSTLSSKCLSLGNYLLVDSQRRRGLATSN